MVTLADINQYFSNYLPSFDKNSKQDFFLKQRGEAADNFRKIGMPDKKSEVWRDVNWENIIKSKSFVVQKQAEEYQPIENYFQCSTQDINAEMFAFLNGWYVHYNAPLTIFPTVLFSAVCVKPFNVFPIWS